MPRVIHFEIPADDPGRASKFYDDVFGWKFDKWKGPQEYWLVTGQLAYCQDPEGNIFGIIQEDSSAR